MARRRRNYRRRNATTVVVRSRRRNRHHARGYHRRRRNPDLFGSQVSATEMGKAILGGLVGVTVAKLVPPMLPAGLTGSPALRVLVTGAIAFGAGMLGRKLGGHIGSAIMFGGLMQTASIALNAFLPSIGGQIGLAGRGMGDIVPGGFSQPQNIVNWRALAAPPAPMAAPASMGRVFGHAF